MVCRQIIQMRNLTVPLAKKSLVVKLLC
jgi:hypothetical protein